MEAARMYEKYFLAHMTKAMRSTVSFSDITKPSMGEGIYREQLDEQYVDAWTERGGIGLANVIHDEMMGKLEMAKAVRQASRDREALSGAKRGIAFTNRDVLELRRLPTTGPPGSETVLVAMKPTTTKPNEPQVVFAPWPGRIESVKSENEKTQIEIAVVANAGLPSRRMSLAFAGVPLNVTPGTDVVSGQTIGQLAPGARGLLIRQTIVQVEKTGRSGPDSAPE